MDCKDTSCVDVKEADFPILLISLDPDSTFPLLPSDYVECSSKYFFYFIQLLTARSRWIWKLVISQLSLQSTVTVSAIVLKPNPHGTNMLMVSLRGQ